MLTNPINKNKKQIAAEDVPIFEKAREKLDCFHKEIEKLSAKKPDGHLSVFKLGFINQVLVQLNRILGEEFRPFPDFSTFDVEGSFPSASDALMMLSQYRTALANFSVAHHIVVSRFNPDYPGHTKDTSEWYTGQDDDQTGGRLDEAEPEGDIEEEEDDELEEEDIDLDEVV